MMVGGRWMPGVPTGGASTFGTAPWRSTQSEDIRKAWNIPGASGGPNDPLWATSTASGSRQSSRQGGQYFADPGLAQATMNAGLGLGQDLAKRYSSLVQNPTGSPLFQGLLAGTLGTALPYQAKAGMDLASIMRAAGAGGNIGTSYDSRAGAALGGNLMREKMSALGRLIPGMLPSALQAAYAPVSQIPSIIDASKLASSAAGSQGISSSESRTPVYPPAGYTPTGSNSNLAMTQWTR